MKQSFKSKIARDQLWAVIFVFGVVEEVMVGKGSTDMVHVCTWERRSGWERDQSDQWEVVTDSSWRAAVKPDQGFYGNKLPDIDLYILIRVMQRQICKAV